VRPSHILVRTALSIYSFYLLRCTHSFYYKNLNILHIYTESAVWLSGSVKSLLPLSCAATGAFLIFVPRPTPTPIAFTDRLRTHLHKEQSCLHHILLHSTPTPLLPFVPELGRTTRPAAPAHSIWATGGLPNTFGLRFIRTFPILTSSIRFHSFGGARRRSRVALMVMRSRRRSVHIRPMLFDRGKHTASFLYLVFLQPADMDDRLIVKYAHLISLDEVGMYYWEDGRGVSMMSCLRYA
jgi:hypothetical protein